MNQSIQKNKSSKYKGVSFHKRQNKWQSQIMVNKKHINIGTFYHEIIAALAYNIKAQELFGEYANLNDIRK